MLVWNAHKTKVRSLAFSPDGTQLASGAERTASVRLWESISGKQRGELRGRWGETSALSFAPTGNLLATTTMRNHVVLWDTAARTAISAPRAPTFRHGSAFAPDGAWVGVSGFGGVVGWHDPATPRPVTLGRSDGVEWLPDERFTLERKSVSRSSDSLAFSPDGRRLAAHGIHSTAIWDRKTRKVERVIEHNVKTDVRTVVAFAPDSERLGLGFDKFAEIHPVRGKAKPLKLIGHTRVVRAIGFTPDGRTAMTAAGDGTVRFWDAATGAQLRAFDWGVGALYRAAFSADGLLCAADGELGQVVVWDADG
jgi:WD40 repeat protein